MLLNRLPIFSSCFEYLEDTRRGKQNLRLPSCNVDFGYEDSIAMGMIASLVSLTLFDLEIQWVRWTSSVGCLSQASWE